MESLAAVSFGLGCMLFQGAPLTDGPSVSTATEDRAGHDRARAKLGLLGRLADSTIHHIFGYVSGPARYSLLSLLEKSLRYIHRTEYLKLVCARTLWRAEIFADSHLQQPAIVKFRKSCEQRDDGPRDWVKKHCYAHTGQPYSQGELDAKIFGGLPGQFLKQRNLFERLECETKAYDAYERNHRQLVRASFSESTRPELRLCIPYGAHIEEGIVGTSNLCIALFLRPDSGLVFDPEYLMKGAWWTRLRASEKERRGLVTAPGCYEHARGQSMAIFTNSLELIAYFGKLLDEFIDLAESDQRGPSQTLIYERFKDFDINLLLSPCRGPLRQDLARADEVSGLPLSETAALFLGEAFGNFYRRRRPDSVAPFEFIGSTGLWEIREPLEVAMRSLLVRAERDRDPYVWDNTLRELRDWLARWPRKLLDFNDQLKLLFSLHVDRDWPYVEKRLLEPLYYGGKTPASPAAAVQSLSKSLNLVNSKQARVFPAGTFTLFSQLRPQS